MKAVLVQTERIVALSIIQDGTADQDSDVLVKGNVWDTFGDASSNASAGMVQWPDPS